MYPYDTPSTTISGYWLDGSYTPFDAMSYIKDDYTPINKNTMINSVGKNISLLQNFVNSKYLGRSGTYVQNSYTQYTHVYNLISSGYVDGNNVGSVKLCSHLYPDTSNTLWLGEYEQGAGSGNYFRGVSATKGQFQTLSGWYGPDNDFIGLYTDIVPITDGKLSLGHPDFRFGSLEVSGVNCTSLTLNSLVSSGFVNTSIRGDIFLCSNMVPAYSDVELGSASTPFKYLFITDVILSTTNDSYPGSANVLWVDSNGYVRRGNYS